MSYKLEKTFFSRSLTPASLFVALLSLLALIGIFHFAPPTFVASHEVVFGKKEYWRAFTSALMHADLVHLSHNAFFFTGLAFILNGYFGGFVFPILSLVMGGTINLITLWFYPPNVNLEGISGVVYFMAAFWLISFILIERKQSLKKRIIYASGMALIFFFPETFRPQTSYLAHSVGFILGIATSFLYFSINRHKIRTKEVWIYRPETPIEFDWQDNNPKSSNHNEEKETLASHYTHKSLHTPDSSSS